MTTTTVESQVTRHTWVPYAAIVAGALLLLESVLVIASEDSLPDAPLIAMLDAGWLLALAAAIGVGRRQRRGRRALVALGLAVALVAYVIGFSEVVGMAFEAMSDAPWVADEGPLGVLGAVLLLLGARGR
ncbi:MAG: hypothetical protein ABR549_13675 [Mycobacteriales bacterium]